MLRNDKDCVRPVITKTLVKGTILLAIFSIFLEVTPSKIINYIIFIVMWYVLLGLYMLWKHAHKYCIINNAVIIKGLIRNRIVRIDQIIDCFISQGILAKHFNCGSLYLVLQGNKVIIIKDIIQPDMYYNLICRNIIK